MARTPSTMLPLGTPAPDFQLPDTDGRTVSLSDYADRDALVVMFICNHCPFVKLVADELAKIGHDYAEKSVGIVAINSNDVENYPDDAPDKMAEEKAARGYPFPYLFDEDQSVAQAYRAACTPDFYVFDKHRKLTYRGQMDGARPGNDQPVDGSDLREAIEAALAGREIAEQIPSIGCNIKWKVGNAPDYFAAK